MARQFWLNLPVKDLARSREFFTQLGFAFNDRHGQSGMVSLVVGNGMVNLFPHAAFTGFAAAPVADTAGAAEVLLSLDADSRDEVDALAGKAQAAGAVVFCEPTPVQGWMYGCGFADLDGHRWNVLHMDSSQMPRT
jgi:predicted lactoylglutathione lyase